MIRLKALCQTAVVALIALQVITLASRLIPAPPQTINSELKTDLLTR